MQTNRGMLFVKPVIDIIFYRNNLTLQSKTNYWRDPL